MSGRQDALYGIELAAARLWTDIHPQVEAIGAAGEAGVLAARLRLRHAAWTPAAGPLTLRDLEVLARGLPDRVGIDTAPLDLDAIVLDQLWRRDRREHGHFGIGRSIHVMQPTTQARR